MANLKFDDYKDRIIAAIQGKVGSSITEPVTLVDGFVNQPLQSEFTGGLVIGGPALPLVVVVGNSTGRVYYFALKVLIPDIDLK